MVRTTTCRFPPRRLLPLVFALLVLGACAGPEGESSGGAPRTAPASDGGARTSSSSLPLEEGPREAGLRLFQEGDFEGARPLLEAALEEDPRDRVVLEVLGGIYATDNRFEQAERLLRRAIAVDPDAAAARLGLSAVLIDTGRYDEALSALREARRIVPDHVGAMIKEALVLARLGRNEEAEEAARRAIAREEGHPEGHYVLGMALMQRGDLEGAAAALDRTLAVRPNHLGALDRRAIVAQRLGNSEEAQLFRERHREVSSKLRVGEELRQHRQKGTDAFNRGDFEAALKEFQWIASSAPSDHQVFLYMGSAHIALGNLEEALAALERSLELAPRDARTLMEMGRVHGLANRLDEAVALLDRAAAANPEFAEPHYFLAGVHRARGEEDLYREEMRVFWELKARSTGAVMEVVLGPREDGGEPGGEAETPPAPSSVGAPAGGTLAVDAPAGGAQAEDGTPLGEELERLEAASVDGGFGQFEDGTAAAGIDFRHINGATGEKYMLETLGSGVCVFDYDGDGRQDIYFVQSGSLPGFESERQPESALYRNLGGGRFTETTAEAGVGGPDRYGFGCVAGDVDGDGDRDLYVTYYGPNVLYRNDGDGTFTEVGAAAGVADPLWGASAGFADYDGDGDLDLYLVNYVDYDLVHNYYCGDNRPGYRAVCHPKNFGSQPDVLFRNRGDGTFEDVTEAAAVVDLVGKGLGVVWGDYDLDRDPDIYVANDDTPNFLFKNRGDGTFEEIAELVGVAYSEDGHAQAGMGTDMGDYDNDGRLDLFVTNLAEETNELYHNDGEWGFSHVTFSAGLGGPSLMTLGMGTFFFDPDNDGDLDLFVANGHIMDNIGLYSDTISFEQPLHLFRNLGEGRFERFEGTASGLLERPHVGRGAVPFDYDDDGDIDIVLAQNDRPARLLRNAGRPSGHWVALTLFGQPPNADAIGAWVEIEAGGSRQVRYARTAFSYMSQGDRRLHVGLGETARVDRVVVDWPGEKGFREEFTDIAVDSFVDLRLGEGRRLLSARGSGR